VHIQNYGWRIYEHITPNTIIGTSGESLRIESINLMLNGTDKYKLQYRVHIQNLGWTPWFDQGRDAGTSGRSLRLEAMQIILVEK
ncbi:MAG: peptidase M4, partial [Lachnospiraceae bacterium]|nr:peptidase M4 [Lachnospiraceae bacterium]